MISGNFSTSVNGIFIFIVVLSAILLAGITAAMIYFLFRYHHTRNKQPKDIEGNLVLEVLWTVIPTIVVMGFFAYGWKGYREMASVPENAITVETTGRMWSWAFQYENGAQSDTLYVPANTPVHLKLTSSDVIHSFYIPAFKVKKDVVPGMNTEMWFSADEPGKYQVFCAEYCGYNHAYMLTKVVALPQAEFEAWYKRMGEGVATQPAGEAAAEAAPSPERGEMLVTQKGCIACHSTDGTPRVGPSFGGLFGKTETVLVNGEEKQVVVDEEYIRRSVWQPDAEKVKGFEAIPMPPQQVTDEELEAIIAYIKTLK
ncbi:MAG: cytochrome c oxidase subunit II [Calditrichaeota bacterium]|nr:MAG: cytochrome c oxidase subunit II [Calditrichota bacterium]